jgi:hypothetical protein
VQCGRLKAFLKTGAIEHDERMAAELSAVEYLVNRRDQIQLERKENIKSRGLASPADVDALALTHSVAIAMPCDTPTAAAARQKEHDPCAYMDARGPLLPFKECTQHNHFESAGFEKLTEEQNTPAHNHRLLALCMSAGATTFRTRSTSSSSLRSSTIRILTVSSVLNLDADSMCLRISASSSEFIVSQAQ